MARPAASRAATPPAARAGRQASATATIDADATAQRAATQRRIVMARGKTYEQRTTIPKMRVGAGRQRSLHVESRPLPQPVRLPRLPRPSLRLGLVTPARAASLILAATCVALIAFVFASDAFYVYTADIQGNRLVSAQDVYARSGIDGLNIFQVRPSEALRRLRDLPFVKDARVSVSLPAHIAIQVEERSPAIVWQAAGASYGVADDGTVLPAEGAPPGAPVVVAEGSALQYGAKLEPQLIELARRLPGLIPDAQRLVFSNQRGLGVVTAQGWPAYFGSQDDATAARVAVLNSLTAELKREKTEPEFVDLRVASRPYYKTKATSR